MAAAGIAAGVALPLGGPGIGWPLVAVTTAAATVFALRRSPVETTPMTADPMPGPGRIARWGWAVTAVLLFAVAALRTSGWLVSLCLLAGCAAGSLAVAGGRSLRDLVFGTLAVPVGGLIGLGWLARGVAGRGGTGGGRRTVAPVLVSLALLLVFVPLLSGADERFADLLSALVPAVGPDSVARTVVAFCLVAAGTAGACYVVVARPVPAAAAPLRGRLSLRRTDWALPVGVLCVLFGVYVAVQLVALFGGSGYVLRTSGLTYAEHARGGFWQLCAVSVLTLGVITLVLRWADTGTAANRTWLRSLVATLGLLTLVIVASAVFRMWTYQQAYGFTVLRLGVMACELWLGVVYVLVIVAGIRLRPSWLSRAIAGTGFAVLLGLALLNPDRFIADRNIDRWERTGRLDVRYLSGLSLDAVPAYTRLPLELRACAVLRHRPEQYGQRSWYEWTIGRTEAVEVVTRTPVAGDCYPRYP
ncbi:DUF4153 domain-containing protein [Amycolatopsis suaedae]|uniref:DUF4173 domain-containing protein n=1 Tax=Amycolatopsis suaedae TaxID=2510978 RepID=A0A4Q7J8Y5_9PSEU|nr:DUF4173 domain-containing protein [Amycolatopsis suaedae]RZQ63332.1 DUF4173 domain-containing protein [Amycolatopsis suaedae]